MNIKNLPSHPYIRIAKRILFVLFLGLVILDLVLIAVDGKVTISRIVHHSSPTFMIIIWILGIATSNVFLPQKRKPYLSHSKRLAILTVLGIGLLILGFQVDSIGAEKQCGSITADPEEQAYWNFLEVKCILPSDSNFNAVNCAQCAGYSNCTTKADFTEEIKLIILLFGLVCGHYLWPHVHEHDEPGECDGRVLFTGKK